MGRVYKNVYQSLGKLLRWMGTFWNQPDLLVVKYEDLKKDTINEAERMLMFLKVPFSREDLKKRLSEDFEQFHRPHPKKFEYFTPEQEKRVCERVESVVAVQLYRVVIILCFVMYVAL